MGIYMFELARYIVEYIDLVSRREGVTRSATIRNIVGLRVLQDGEGRYKGNGRGDGIYEGLRRPE